MTLKSMIIKILLFALITIIATFPVSFCFLVFSLVFIPGSFTQTNEVKPIPVNILCGDHDIKGLFYPSGTSTGTRTVILLHGFPSDLGDLFGLGESLSKAGINALTFTYSGIRPSEGLHTYGGALADISAAIAFLGKPEMIRKYGIDTSHIVLIGHCYGGSMALNYAMRNPYIRNIIALEPSEPGEFAREYIKNKRLAAYMDSLFDTYMQPDGPVNFLGKEDLRKEVQDPSQYDLLINASKIADRDILLVTGLDDFVTKTEAHHLPLYRALKKAGASHVKFLTFQTNHGFRNVKEELATEVIRWILSR